MNRYREMKVAHQDEMNDFLSKYAIFAFSPEQFEEQKKKHVSEPGGYVHIGYGCNLLKSRVHEFEALAARHKKEIAEALADPETGAGFAYDMFRHELENHEFSYTLEEDETLEALDIDRAELIRNAMLREALKKAKQDILQEARREDEAPMMRVLVLDPEEGAPREEMTPGSLEEWCRLCKCDNIDIAVRKVGGREYDFIMDDDGPFNMGARVSAVDSSGEPVFVGPLVVCNYDGQGHEASLSQTQFYELMGAVVVLENPETGEKWFALNVE